MAAAHLSKGVLKVSSRVPYFQHIFSDVSGMRTTRQFFEQKISLAENPAWLKFLVSLLLTLFIVAGIWYSFKTIGSVNERLFGKQIQQRLYYLIPISYGSIFFITILLWRWIY